MISQPDFLQEADEAVNDGFVHPKEYMAFGDEGGKDAQGTNFLVTVAVPDAFTQVDLELAATQVGASSTYAVKLAFCQQLYLQEGVDMLKQSTLGAKFIGQVEVGSGTERMHLHLVINLPKNIRFPRLQKFLREFWSRSGQIHVILVTNKPKAIAYVTKDHTRFLDHEGKAVSFSHELKKDSPSDKGKRTDVGSMLDCVRDMVIALRSNNEIYLHVSSLWPTQYVQFHGAIERHISLIRVGLSSDVGKLAKLNHNQQRWWDAWIGDNCVGGTVPYDDRTVNFVVDAVGATGKSAFISHCVSHFPDLCMYLTGTLANMQAFVTARGGKPPRVIFIDLTRSAGVDVSFAETASMIEQLKSGRVMSGKYNPAQATLEWLHVVVMCNELPLGVRLPIMTKVGERLLFSADRVKIQVVHKNGGPVFENMLLD